MCSSRRQEGSIPSPTRRGKASRDDTSFPPGGYISLTVVLRMERCNDLTRRSYMGPQPTVLIVDDEKHTRDGLRRLLENDYDVYVAADIAGAMGVLERDPIDLLLT